MLNFIQLRFYDISYTLIMIHFIVHYNTMCCTGIKVFNISVSPSLFAHDVKYDENGATKNLKVTYIM